MPFSALLSADPADVTSSNPVSIDFTVLLGDAAFVTDILAGAPYPWGLIFWWDFPPDWPGIGEPGVFPDPSDPTLGVNTRFETTALDWFPVGTGLLEATGFKHTYTPPAPGVTITPLVYLSFYFDASDPTSPGDSVAAFDFFAVTGGPSEPPPLRLGQRNDGRGPVGHARLNKTSSIQRPGAPRVGGKNTLVEAPYDICA